MSRSKAATASAPTAPRPSNRLTSSPPCPCAWRRFIFKHLSSEPSPASPDSTAGVSLILRASTPAIVEPGTQRHLGAEAKVLRFHLHVIFRYSPIHRASMPLYSRTGKSSESQCARGRSSRLFPGPLALRPYRNYWRVIAAKLRFRTPQIEDQAFLSDLETGKLGRRMRIELRWSRGSNDVFCHGPRCTSVVRRKGPSKCRKVRSLPCTTARISLLRLSQHSAKTAAPPHGGHRSPVDTIEPVVEETPSKCSDETSPTSHSAVNRRL